MKIGIIGGGASGLTAAINAKNISNEVIIFEQNDICGKKILATGNGRCNYWNEDQSLSHYQSSEDHLIPYIINEESSTNVVNFFNKLGIIPKLRNGYYYPFSNQASTIRNVLLNEAIKKKIIIKNNFLIKSINPLINGFIIFSEKESIYIDKLVIATGSYASLKTEQDTTGYVFLKNLGHTIIKPLPALVQLKTEPNCLNRCSGVRTEVKVTSYENGRKAREEYGEIQLTNYGLSGICIFNLSNSIARGLQLNKKEEVHIDFLPFVQSDKKLWFRNQTKLTNKNIKELLLSVLNAKLVESILKDISLPVEKLFTNLTASEQDKLISSITDFKVLIKATNSFNEAQVCSGGVKLSEIDLNTMESRLIKNLYIIGELIDLTGDCGGYNLGIAWISAIKAGKALKGEYND